MSRILVIGFGYVGSTASSRPDGPFPPPAFHKLRSDDKVIGRGECNIHKN